MDRSAKLAADLDRRRAVLVLAGRGEHWDWELIASALQEFEQAARPPVPRDWDRRPFRPVPRCRLVAGHGDGCILFLDDGAEPAAPTEPPSHGRSFLSRVDGTKFCCANAGASATTPEQIMPVLLTIEAATRAVLRAKSRGRP